MKYWIETYGCQMNKAESAALEVELRGLGLSPAEADAEADLVLLNTCSVRQTAENRIWGRLGHYRRLKQRRAFLLGIMGCMGERLAGEVQERVPEVDLVMGVFDRQRLVDALESGRVGQGEPPPELHVADDEYAFARVHGDAGFRVLLPIMHGCDNFCSYCIVPYVRGREVSRPAEDIRAELAQQAARGVKEVTLLGQNVNSYRSTGGDLDFAGLLERIEEWVRGTSIRWVRFLTSHPKDLSDGVIAALARSTVLCRHVHLPVQHGSDAVLERMGRRYTRDGYLELVRRLRNAVPDVSVSTDILVGFPGETDADHRQTLELMEEVGFDDAFTYHYNVRAGTRAALWEDTVADAEKRRRLAEVIELQRAISGARRRGLLGRRATVLVEEVSRNNPGELLARTAWNHMAVFGGGPELVGSFVTLSLEELRGNTLWGKLVGDPG